jgi:N-acetylated-alpha-linked acidic dipeptidase
MAEFTLQRFKDAGLDNAHIDEHDVYLTYPLSASLSMSSPIVYNATLTEPYIPEDPTSGDSRIIFPFNAYSASGIVQAPMVYVNYGRPEDYVALARLVWWVAWCFCCFDFVCKKKRAGVSAQNKIVLVRYGMLFRGLKARIAQENGAIGVVIYSDPQDDGIFLRYKSLFSWEKKVSSKAQCFPTDLGVH